MENLESKIFGIISEGNSESTQKALECYTDAGGRSLSAATYIGMGAVLGPLTILASLVGRRGTDTTAKNVTTQEAFVFSALMVIASCKVHSKAAQASDTVGIETVFSAEAVCNAVEWFKHIFGKAPDGFVLDSLLTAAREVQADGAVIAGNLLHALCANRKPA